MGKRRKNDFYETPEWATQVLWEMSGYGLTQKGRVIVEPCVGDGAISKVLEANGACVLTNDIDYSKQADWHWDAAKSLFWENYTAYKHGKAEWVVTNPPFKHAFEILKFAYKHATIGVAMLLRLSFLEPTYKRAAWLAEHPPNRIIVLPRISFTGDGKTDSVTCAWMVWEHAGAAEQSIKIVPRAA